MVIVIEPNLRGHTHAVFNSSMIVIIATAFPDSEIAFIACSSHLEAVKNLLDATIRRRVVFKEVDIPCESASYGRSVMENFRTFTKALSPIDRHAFIFVTSSTRCTILALWLALKYAGSPGVFAHVVFHGNAKELAGWRSRNPVQRIRDFRSSVKMCRDQRLRYIVLEPHIRDSICRILPELEPKVDVLPHPVSLETQISDEVILKLSHPIRIAYLGLGTRPKGFGLFLEVAQYFNGLCPDKVEFAAFGRLSPEMDGVDQSSLRHSLGKGYLDRSAFFAELTQQHFICIPYQGDHYSYSASGVLLDAIGGLRPIITMRTDATESLFNQFGDLGELCTTPDDMIQKVGSIVEKYDQPRYGRQIDNMKQARERRTAVYLAEVYREICIRGFPEFSYHALKLGCSRPLNW